jgi:sterol desaturase/sphingolipid hydroxylase (fatty acid hydroxylase superfamily)
VTEFPTTWPEQLVLYSTMLKTALSVALARYLLMAVPVFMLCYVLLGRVLSSRRIQDRSPSTSQIARELGLSISSSIVFALIDVAVILLSVKGYMRLRVFDPNPGMLEFLGTLVALLIVHDAYFYWAHRFMHWGPVFRLAHSTHHKSLNPTPFAAFAFHPIEAVIEYAFVPIVALVAPVHVMPLLVFGLFMTAMNIYAHLGLEFMPRGFARHPLGRFILTPTHHDLHHTSPGYDYAFYFNVWDRLMGTKHPGYEDAFNAASERRPAPAATHAA